RTTLTTAGHLLPTRYSYFLHIFFFFNATAPTAIYTLSLHDALPILPAADRRSADVRHHHHDRRRHRPGDRHPGHHLHARPLAHRSEEHTSELQSRENLVCRLLLEKKNKNRRYTCRRLTYLILRLNCR